MQPTYTIDEAQSSKAKIKGECISCGRVRMISPGTFLLAGHPGDTAIPTLGTRMRCFSCGEKRVRTSVEMEPA